MTKTNISDINECRERVVSYYNDLCSFFIDRDEILKMMITATVAQEPILFVGRPGTAKSLLVSVFCEGIGLQQSEYFEYMLTKFTEPGEVMGPVDINALKKGKYIRKTQGLLPEAKIAFLDEIFKANSAILNMLLTIINERKYYEEGAPVKVPLVMLFAASNEIPDFSEFDALKDRFILKMETVSVKDSHFHELIKYGIEFECRKRSNSKPWKSDCSLEDFKHLNDYVLRYVLPQMVKNEQSMGSEKMTKAFKTIIDILENELAIEITDRKLIKLYKLIVTQAFLFNGGKVTMNDMRLLCYCGNNFKDIRKIKKRLTVLLENM
ncbi:AAA family ATPase [Candidatus Uabimicrobium sp. HlEnr_7]|uniref:AAA family ATPase n=1 Tax=Candidatus Uabimicrobium helgolandensis TaxID=3095367 RepID=UPI0035568F7C